MFIIIIGSGRTGSRLAGILSEKGHDVVIVDKNTDRFSLLPIEFSGFKVEGDVLEQSVLKEAKVDQADLVIVTTGNDKVNYMVTQLSKHVFEVPSVLVRVVEPRNTRMYEHENAVETISPISLLVDTFAARVEGFERNEG